MTTSWKRLICRAWLCLVPFSGNAATPIVSAGYSHAVALKSDGTVLTWGNDSQGQLGLGRVLSLSTPTPVNGLGAISTIAVAPEYSLALAKDGSVWAWGRNDFGQLGNGTGQSVNKPQQIKGLSGVVAIAAGETGGLALMQDGTVWAWGYPYGGTPKQVQGLTGIKAVAAGAYHGLALKLDGTVWAWGTNEKGQLGDGTTTFRTSAVQVTGLTGISAIAGGGSYPYSLALKPDGTVWAWGDNTNGQLGDGTTTSRTVPTQVSGLTAVASVEAGDSTSFAIKQDGTVLVWGHNSAFHFGDSSGAPRLTPVSPPGLTGISTISYGRGGTVVLKQDGKVYRSRFGGNGQFILVEETGVAGATALGAGTFHTLAMKQDGTVLVWGGNDSGQLGDGAILTRNAPTQVPGVANVVYVHAGANLTYALKADGTGWAWGDGRSGQFGNGTSESRSSPVPISGMSGITAISSGRTHSLALNQDGTVLAAGDNSRGQLGSTTPDRLSVFARIQGLTGVRSVAAGWGFTVVAKQDGTVWTAGLNDVGQLGDGTSSNRSAFALASELSGILAVATGGNHALALKQDGTVWGWGNNNKGQLGDGTTTSRASPVQVKGLTGVIAIAAGGDDTGGYAGVSLALRQDGTVWAWGGNNFLGGGNLGNGSSAGQSTPVQLATDANAIALGTYNGLALRKDSTVMAWGSSYFGELGDGTFAERRAPVLVVNPTVDDFLILAPGTAFEVPPSIGVPFFVGAAGEVSGTNASLITTTKFNTSDIGKSGAVFVTAAVPPGTLAALQATTIARSVSPATARAGSGTPAYVLIQLTSSGWQEVVNGQLIPYASGVLGDQLSAQTILNNTDTTNLKGAQFCLGYGLSADQMVATGTMRAVATIADPDASGLSAATCIVTGPTVSYSMQVAPGWNLLGNGLNQSLSVAALYGNSSAVNTVWKWDAARLGWQFYTPALDSAALQAYAVSKGYAVLTEVRPGEGYWVNAKAQMALGTQSGASFITTSTSLAKGWNLVSTGNDVTPPVFETNLKSSLSGKGAISLWAWDTPLAKWYFYAPSLEAQGGSALATYISSNGYLDFAQAGKTLGSGVGFWVNR